MNTLSILIYLAGVLPRVSGILFFIPLIFVTVYLFVRGIEWVNAKESRDRDWFKDNPKVYNFKFIILCLTVMLFSCIIPSENTFYLIAASEMGETVVANPETIEIFDLLKETVKTKLEEQISE